MASLHRVKQHGREVYRLSWWDKNGKRCSIRLGDIGQKSAESIRHHVERLVDLAAAGSPIDGQETAWLNKIGQTLTDKLAMAGLIPERQSATLAEFADAYLDSRKDMKPNSIRIYRTARDSLVSYFGEKRDLRGISPGEASEWRQSMVNAKLAEPTISKRVALLKRY